ncbi:MAG: glutaredoxin domain-containing protein [Desulfobacterales bacterium]|jgi:glutaredoxin
MKKHLVFLIAIVAGIILCGVTIAQIYTWIDENGVIHLSDSPLRDSVSREGIEVIPDPETEPRAVRRPNKNIRKDNRGSFKISPSLKKTKKAKSPKIELYTTSWCKYCQNARDFFRSRGIPFTEYDVEKDASAARRKNQLTRHKGVPFAVINGKRITGFNKAAYIQALSRE